MSLSMWWHAIRLHQVARTKRELYGFKVWRCECGEVWFR